MMVNSFKTVCLSCNKELGRSESSEGMQIRKCQFCGGVKISTQKLEYEDRRSFDYDVIVLNKSSGVSIKSGFTISPKEYIGADSKQLQILLATRLSESLHKSLTTKGCFDLVSEKSQYS